MSYRLNWQGYDTAFNRGLASGVEPVDVPEVISAVINVGGTTATIVWNVPVSLDEEFNMHTPRTNVFSTSVSAGNGTDTLTLSLEGPVYVAEVATLLINASSVHNAETEYNEEIEFVCTNNSELLRPVTDLSAELVSPTQINWTWVAGTDVSGDNGYDVQSQISVDSAAFVDIANQYIASDEFGSDNAGSSYTAGQTIEIRVRRIHSPDTPSEWSTSTAVEVPDDALPSFTGTPTTLDEFSVTQCDFDSSESTGPIDTYLWEVQETVTETWVPFLTNSGAQFPSLSFEELGAIRTAPATFDVRLTVSNVMGNNTQLETAYLFTVN